MVVPRRCEEGVARDKESRWSEISTGFFTSAGGKEKARDPKIAGLCVAFTRGAQVTRRRCVAYRLSLANAAAMALTVSGSR
ncbi:hypothetical protein PFI31113_00210 [Pandoraea fibrosis]|uniref:Uncharacterized protein n=1 Tax=Pandoraea fibrosis TaxID=1891094 RepID=A0A5E4RJI3_9BURK|nr:hypothetical protein PFI31113_00210 [Pandoraea fibrosis]